MFGIDLPRSSRAEVGLSTTALEVIARGMIPWSAAHEMDGKFIALSESVYDYAGFHRRFKAGDIIFGRTVLNGQYYPVIYAVKAVREYHADPTMDLAWELRLLGGYGRKKLTVLYASGTGENPHLTHEWYFRDTDMDIWRVMLNYYAEKGVRNGKTIWDVDQKLRES